MAIDTIKSTAVLDGAIATADIADANITTAKIADDAVTSAKIATLTGDVSHGDSVKAKFGASDDLQVYHDGSNSYVRDSGTGNLRLTTESSVVLAKHNNENMLKADVDGAVTLYHDAGAKLATTATGVSVTGSLGVGTSTPDTKVQIKGAVNSAQLILGGTDGRGLKISTFNEGGQNDSTAIYDAQDTEGSAVNSHHVFKSGGTETLRIRGDGDLFWHAAASSSSAGIAFTNTTHPSITVSGGSDTNYRHRIVFVNGNGTVGIISTSGSSTAYGTSSDYRLKENVDYTWDATTRLKQLKPARFNFIADPDTTVDGFLAHEAQSVVPESVTGTHNGMKDEEYEVTPAVLDDDGNITTEAVMGTRSVPDIQGIDQSKLVPLLVKTIQELEARITALEDA